MVKLTDIQRTGDTIRCKAYVEDCEEPVNLMFHIRSHILDDFTLPNGYEYCDWHILIYAKKYLEEAANMVSIPKEKLIMWY